MIFLGCNNAIGIWKDCLKRIGITPKGIVDSDYYGNTKRYAGIPVIGTEDNIEEVIERAKFSTDDSGNNMTWHTHFFIGTNWDPSAQPMTREDRDRNNAKRQKLIDIAEKYNLPMGSIIDPTAIVPNSVKLGKGVYIGAGAVIEPQVKIGDYTQVWYQTIIGHKTKIGKDCVLQRRAGVWGAEVGNHVYMGIGSVYAGNYNTSKIGNNAWLHPGIGIHGREIAEGETVTVRTQLRQKKREMTIHT